VSEPDLTEFSAKAHIDFSGASLSL